MKKITHLLHWLKQQFAMAGQKLRDLFSIVKKKSFGFVDRRPLTSFLGLLGLLFLLIITGNKLRQPPTPVEKPAAAPKHVDVYSIGTNPRIGVTAKIEQSGALKLVAQTSGVVQKIYKTEGTAIKRGEWLISLSTNYQGGNVPQLTREIAQKNAEFIKNNYDTQKEIISKKREIANSVDAQSDQMRDITNQSVDDTKNLISLNEDIVTSLNAQIEQLESTNVGGANDSLILQVKEGKAGILNALNALKSSLRNVQLQGDENKAPAEVSNQTRELTLKQLDLEEKSLDLNREISQLNLRIAQITESLMYPTTPCDGTVERVNVHVGDVVNPGTLLATITANVTTTTAVITTSSEIALSMSRVEPSKLLLEDDTVGLYPRYISQEPTEGTLHTILFTVPAEKAGKLKNGMYVNFEIPIAKPKSLVSIPFIPIDSIYETQNQAYVFVVVTIPSGSLRVESRPVELGQVIGSYVEVKKGLMEKDQVIINRNVIAGDEVIID